MKITPLLIALLLLACTLSSGCIETGTRSYTAGGLLAGISVVEHTYLLGREGLFTKQYDVTARIGGVTVLEVKGVTKSDVDAYLKQYANPT
ncbi:MAG: hypothetical protein A4E35_00091 [Methanoregula sp. PtaU1.Bin051]|nr:MAG: hypothetical protein A4E35_00091 [Methanoregula sp. PtaU1.Bin051]